MGDTEETIVAIATAPGKGGIGIVRLSGALAKTIAGKMIQTSCVLIPRQAHFCTFIDQQGQPVDQGLLLYFPAPHSFTGEDVIEFQGHGGPVVLDQLVETCIHRGARQARAGEFSLRAFLNGRIDLTRAEAIADLIDASTRSAARAAVHSLQGAFAEAVGEIIEKLISLRVHVEAAIDFPEEEIDFLSDGNISKQLAELINQINGLLDSASQARLLRDGMTIVIAGRPNAGKSSLLNALSGHDSAIVTDIPGTTRDVLREQIDIGGVPVTVIDTAGLRESPDRIEQEGVRRAWAEIHRADLVLVVADITEIPEPIRNLADVLPVEDQLLAELQIPWLLVRNKSDLVDATPDTASVVEQVTVSALTGAGLDTLRQALLARIGYQAEQSSHFSARRRHISALDQALAALQTGSAQLEQHRAGELLAEDLRTAQQALEEITGAFRADDLLGRIFSSFCIGK